jgi:RTX calcium-binding nonapeptide repeat (4 copies)
MRWLALAVAVSLSLAASAEAARLEIGSEADGCDPSACAEDVLDIVAARGELNRMEVTPARRGVLVRDEGAPLTGCRPAADGARVCRGSFERVYIYLGDGDDVLVLRGTVETTVSDGPGDDRLNLLTAYAFVGVGPGADLIELQGGGVEYGARTAPVSVRFNGLPDDGEAGEGDDIRGSVGYMAGGSADDLLEAGPTGSALEGGGGADVLWGGPAADILSGGEGDDVMQAEGGDDVLHVAGGPGDSDVVAGGPGRDRASYERLGVPVFASIGDGANDGTAGEADDIGADVEDLTGTWAADVLVGDGEANALDGGHGGDSLRAGAGADRLIGRFDRDPDLLDAGPGSDRVEAGVGDRVVAADGEADRVSCGGSGLALEWDPADVFSACAPRLVIGYRATRQGRSVLLTVRCEKRAADPCSGTLTLRKRGELVSAPVSFRGLPSGASRRLRVRLLAPVRGCLGAVAVTLREEPASRTRSTQVALACRS